MGRPSVLYRFFFCQAKKNWNLIFICDKDSKARLHAKFQPNRRDEVADEFRKLQTIALKIFPIGNLKGELAESDRSWKLGKVRSGEPLLKEVHKIISFQTKVYHRLSLQTVYLALPFLPWVKSIVRNQDTNQVPPNMWRHQNWIKMCLNMHAQWENSIFAEYFLTCEGAVKLPFL